MCAMLNCSVTMLGGGAALGVGSVTNVQVAFIWLTVIFPRINIHDFKGQNQEAFVARAGGSSSSRRDGRCFRSVLSTWAAPYDPPPRPSHYRDRHDDRDYDERRYDRRDYDRREYDWRYNSEERYFRVCPKRRLWHVRLDGGYKG